MSYGKTDRRIDWRRALARMMAHSTRYAGLRSTSDGRGIAQRPGTTNLFAAPNVLDGTVLARRALRKRHTEFLASWLDLMERWFADIARERIRCGRPNAFVESATSAPLPSLALEPWAP